MTKAAPRDAGLSALEEALGHEFADPGLLERALTHPSYCQAVPDAEHNQRLEFLGDSVLGLVLADALYHAFPKKREGVLTHNRSMLAKGAHLSGLAAQLGLPARLRMSEAEVRNGGRERASILEDALEAVIGAIYLDSDFQTTHRVVRGWLGNLEQRLGALGGAHNPKGRLQELLQPGLGNGVIDYCLVETEGPDHARCFTFEVYVAGTLAGRGSGSSKKEAEEQAAAAALARYENEDDA
ncbi:MAG: ribonuclease III [Verrucomicrobiota bacterium]